MGSIVFLSKYAAEHCLDVSENSKSDLPSLIIGTPPSRMCHRSLGFDLALVAADEREGWIFDVLRTHVLVKSEYGLVMQSK